MSLATPSRLDRLFGTSPEEDYDRRYVAFTGGLIIGSGIWTILIGSAGAKTMLIVGGGFVVLQLASTFMLPHIHAGQELEAVAT